MHLFSLEVRSCSWWRTIRENSFTRFKDDYLKPAGFFSGKLGFDGKPASERCSNKLTNYTVASMKPVEPWLWRTNQVILRIATQRFVPEFTGERIDMPGADHDCIGMPRRGVKSEPQRFALIHAKKDFIGVAV